MPAIRDYLSKMRDEAYIQIKQGYDDTGATPNELHSSICFSAYVPPAPKKKAKVERTRFRESTHTFRQKSGRSADRRPRNLLRQRTLHRQRRRRRRQRRKRRASRSPARKRRSALGRRRVRRCPRQPPIQRRRTQARCRTQARIQRRPRMRINQPIRWSPQVDREDTLQRASERSEKIEERRSAGKCAVGSGCGRGCRPQTQSAPLGLNGGTATTKKKKKNAATTEEKTRYCEPRRSPPNRSRSRYSSQRRFLLCRARRLRRTIRKRRNHSRSRNSSARASADHINQLHQRAASAGLGSDPRPAVSQGSDTVSVLSGAQCCNLLGRMKDIYICRSDGI